MSGGPQSAMLGGGRRLYLHHGPIDLIIEAFGADDEVIAANGQAVERFTDVLAILVAELDLLRAPVRRCHPAFAGPVARRMAAAVWLHRAVFITPMAAVAGAVADEVLAALTAGRRLKQAYVNNGGDIALHLAPGERLRIGVVANADHPEIDAVATIGAGQAVRGIATSGWRGRSLSLGIADSVTVLARNAAAADAAATLIANSVDIEHAAIVRRPAYEVADESDLGDLEVTVAVGPLPPSAVAEALAVGAARAATMLDQGLIAAALVRLKGRSRLIGGTEGACLGAPSLGPGAAQAAARASPDQPRRPFGALRAASRLREAGIWSRIS